MDTQTDPTRERMMLEQIERDPDLTQASLANQLGVAVGTVNWYIKRFIDKGYVKVKRAQRKKLRYIITSKGITHRADLTVNYIETSMQLYRRTRQRVLGLLAEAKQNGFDTVQIDGQGDIAEICRLTCLEQGISVVDDDPDLVSGSPVLEVRGMKVHLLTKEKI